MLQKRYRKKSTENVKNTNMLESPKSYAS